jgi:hypothetical protein
MSEAAWEAVLVLRDQAADKADAVLLNIYH